MLMGTQFRCYPTPTQATQLLRWIGCQRFIYNAKVQEDGYFRAFKRSAVALAGVPIPIDQQYAQFIGSATQWLREVPSQILRNGAVRWHQAYQKFFKREADRPTFHGKSGRQSVWLTRELFRFVPDPSSTPDQPVYQLQLGTKTRFLGILRFTAHRAYALPASLVISIDAGRWFLSFSYDDALPEPPSVEELLATYHTMSQEDLERIALGGDRGVVTPLVTSDGTTYHFQDAHLERVDRKAKRRRKHQRRLARQHKGSRRRTRTIRTLARGDQYGAHVRQEFAHQTSHTLVTSDAKILIFEDLRIPNMTATPAPKQNAQGRFLQNGRAAKAGLNRAILASAWGQLTRYLNYKAHRLGKLFLVVPPQGTSQACSRCEHRSPDNRLTQARFVCTACGYAAHADHNAAQTIKRRGLRLLREGSFVSLEQTQKTPARQSPSARTTAGTVGCDARGGSRSRRRGHASTTHAPRNRETPSRVALCD